MNRLGKIAALPIVELGPTFVEDGFSPRADLARAEIVFLHAASEEFLRGVSRSGTNKFALNSSNNALRAARKAGLGGAPLELACACLGPLARRRTEIVHFADRPLKEGERLRSWYFGDTLELFTGRMAAELLYYEARRQLALEPPEEVGRRELAETILWKLCEFSAGVVSAITAGKDVDEWPTAPFDEIKAAIESAKDARSGALSEAGAEPNPRPTADCDTGLT